MIHRNNKVNRVYVSASKISRARSVFRYRGVAYLDGGSSIWIPSLKLKYLDRTRVREWADLDGVVYPMLPGEAARTELKREFPDLKRVGWRGTYKGLFDMQMPMYCLEGFKGSGAHVDLRGAYYHIYRNLWLDCAYPCGRGTLHLRNVADALSRWKPARNAVIGICRSLTARLVSRGTSKVIYPDNQFLSPHLWANIQGTLHSLARIAQVCDAVYCMTDGYIFKSQKGARIFLNQLDEWDVPYRVAWGMCHVQGWTSYSTPLKTTHNYRRGFDGGVGFTNVTDYSRNPFKMPEWVYVRNRRLLDEQLKQFNQYASGIR